MSWIRYAAACLAALVGVTAVCVPTVSAQAGGTYSFDMTIPLEPGGTWAIGAIWHFPWSDVVDDEPRLDEADARVVFRDDAGAMLYSRLIARHVLCNGDCHETDAAAAVIPAQPSARRAELYTIDHLGNAVELKAVRERSAYEPVVEILSPSAGQVLTDGTVIEWRATDADGDRLEYKVLYRPSVGYWQQLPLTGRTTDTRHVFTRSGWPADDNATIAIQANDGFNTTEATVTGLRVEGNLPPELYISSPQDGTYYGVRSIVILLAYADDPEDGDLPVSWESDLDGPIHTINWNDGSQGVHRLTASAADSGGLTASATVTIYIGVRPSPALFFPFACKSDHAGVRYGTATARSVTLTWVHASMSRRSWNSSDGSTANRGA